MNAVNIKSFNSSSRLVDLLVITISFLAFALATGWASSHPLIINLFVYVFVVFPLLRLMKRFVFSYFKGNHRILTVIFGNFTGLFFGTLIVVILADIFPVVGINNQIVTFSSLMSFFVLGTLSPMVKSSEHDIIPH